MKLKKLIVGILPLLLLLTLAPAAAQSSIPYQRLLLLIAGPSGDRIDPMEQEVVSYLNGLRGEYNLYNLQMGTMHYDRAQEASILTQNLGFKKSAGVTVGLVQLSDQGIPVRTIYKRENVTPATLQQDHQQLIARWADVSGENIPQELRPSVATSQPNPNSTGGPPISNPQPQPRQSQQNTGMPEQKVQVVYTFEGIRTVVTSLHNQTDAVWEAFKNAPMRDDRMDVPVRSATLGLTEAAKNLRRAHEEGVVYPVEQLQAVRAAGREWRLTEPRIYLPVELRKDVAPILDLLDQVETIEYQARKS